MKRIVVVTLTAIFAFFASANVASAQQARPQPFPMPEQRPAPAVQQPRLAPERPVPQQLPARTPTRSPQVQQQIDELMLREIRTCTEIALTPNPTIRRSTADGEFDTFTTVYGKAEGQQTTLKLRGPLEFQPEKGKLYYFTTLRTLDGEGYYYLVAMEWTRVCGSKKK